MCLTFAEEKNMVALKPLLGDENAVKSLRELVGIIRKRLH